jgi:hypothetical protein
MVLTIPSFSRLVSILLVGLTTRACLRLRLRWALCLHPRRSVDVLQP